MALLLEMIALVQKNWVPQRAGLEDRVFKKLPQAGVLVLNTCYPGPLFLASDVTCRKQIKERHFFSCVLKKSWASGLKVSHWLLCHWCEEHMFLIPTPERYLCSDWTLLCTSHSQTFKKWPCCSTCCSWGQQLSWVTELVDPINICPLPTPFTISVSLDQRGCYVGSYWGDQTLVSPAQISMLTEGLWLGICVTSSPEEQLPLPE